MRWPRSETLTLARARLVFLSQQAMHRCGSPNGRRFRALTLFALTGFVRFRAHRRLRKVYKLLKAMHGLRDAGAAVGRKVLDVMNLMGVSQGKFSICVGYRRVMNTLVRLVRWGDDFSTRGRRSLCDAFRDELGKHLLVKTTAVVGPNVEMGDVQEAIHLNRLSRLYPPGAEAGERWETEAEPRHVEIQVSQMVLSNESKAVSTPGVRTFDEEDGQELGAEGRACHRSWTMRASYLSQSRQM